MQHKELVTAAENKDPSKKINPWEFVLPDLQTGLQTLLGVILDYRTEDTATFKDLFFLLLQQKVFICVENIIATLQNVIALEERWPDLLCLDSVIDALEEVICSQLNFSNDADVQQLLLSSILQLRSQKKELEIGSPCSFRVSLSENPFKWLREDPETLVLSTNEIDDFEEKAVALSDSEMLTKLMTRVIDISDEDFRREYAGYFLKADTRWDEEQFEREKKSYLEKTQSTFNPFSERLFAVQSIQFRHEAEKVFPNFLPMLARPLHFLIAEYLATSLEERVKTPPVILPKISKEADSKVTSVSLINANVKTLFSRITEAGDEPGGLLQPRKQRVASQ